MDHNTFHIPVYTVKQFIISDTLVCMASENPCIVIYLPGKYIPPGLDPLLFLLNKPFSPLRYKDRTGIKLNTAFVKPQPVIIRKISPAA